MLYFSGLREDRGSVVEVRRRVAVDNGHHKEATREDSQDEFAFLVACRNFAKNTRRQ